MYLPRYIISAKVGHTPVMYSAISSAIKACTFVYHYTAYAFKRFALQNFIPPWVSYGIPLHKISQIVVGQRWRSVFVIIFSLYTRLGYHIPEISVVCLFLSFHLNLFYLLNNFPMDSTVQRWYCSRNFIFYLSRRNLACE